MIKDTEKLAESVACGTGRGRRRVKLVPTPSSDVTLRHREGGAG